MLELLEIFKSRMKEKGLTQKDLEKATGISQANISRYLNAKQFPSTKDIIITIAQGLQYTDDEIEELLDQHIVSKPGSNEYSFKKGIPIPKLTLPEDSRLLNVLHKEIKSFEEILHGIEVFKKIDLNMLPVFKAWIKSVNLYSDAVYRLIEEVESVEKIVEDFNDLANPKQE